MNHNDSSGGETEPTQYLFRSKLTQVTVTHSQLLRTPTNTGEGRFSFSALPSPQWGIVL
jgi:hypothetical protein